MYTINRKKRLDNIFYKKMGFLELTGPLIEADADINSIIVRKK